MGVAGRQSGEISFMPRLRRLGMLAAAVSFARSERGQRLIKETRAKYDTPENRAKARQMLADLRAKRTTQVDRRGRGRRARGSMPLADRPTEAFVRGVADTRRCRCADGEECHRERGSRSAYGATRGHGAARSDAAAVRSRQQVVEQSARRLGGRSAERLERDAQLFLTRELGATVGAPLDVCAHDPRGPAGDLAADEKRQLRLRLPAEAGEVVLVVAHVAPHPP